jgi:protein-tyrosine kinase
MMSLIEQAAQRLEQLRQVGVEIPSAPEPVLDPEFEQAPPSVPRKSPLPVHTPEQTVVQSPEMSISRRVNLDMEALSRSGFIRPDSPRSQLADEFRVIKRPLIDNATGKGAASTKNGNLIMITSALPGEGKTFTAANLAMSIAMERDHTVMLVDADVAKPTVLNKLGLAPSRGLLDILLDVSRN